MDFIQGLNGLQVTSCIVRHDFANVCPEHARKRPEKHPNKKAKTNLDGPEYVFYSPFQNDVDAANRYLAVSPRASEVFDLLKAESSDLKARGLSLLWFLLARCDNEASKQYIADHVLTRLSEQIPDLLHLNEDALHYLLAIFMDSVRIGSVDKVRVFLSAYSLFKHFSKGSVPNKSGASPTFSVSRFYRDMVTHEVVDDVGLCDYISVGSSGVGCSSSSNNVGKQDGGDGGGGGRHDVVVGSGRGRGRSGKGRGGKVVDVGSKQDTTAATNKDDDDDMMMSSADLLHSNSKKQLCIVLLLGLKGFNILEKPNVVRLIFEHIKHDTVIDSICTIRLFTLIMSQVLSTQCARLSLTLSTTQWSDVPETVITSTAVALSHIVSQITEEQSLEPEQLVRLNRILVAICTEFIENVETICDVATLCNVLLKFDVTHLSMVDIILGVLRSRAQVAPLYMAGLKCSYSGNMEYMALIKFMSKWFLHVSNLSRSPEDCLSYVPPLLSQAFFNYGLLSSDQWVRHGTLRLLNCLLRLVTNLQDVFSAESGSASSAVHAVAEHVRSIMPDFKTLINVKRYTRKETPDDPEISLNIKNRKRSMVSDALGAVVTSDSGDLILDIKRSDLMLTDWLVALSLYARFVGVGDGKSLYDPCKLLKDEVIEANTTEMTAALRESDGQSLHKLTMENGVELDMALMECLFRLGIGELHSGLVLTKVQRLCFHHILRRYMDLKCAKRSITKVGELVCDYLSRCEGYVRHVLECSGIFSSPVDPWIVALENESAYQMFTFLFDYCMENPLDVVLGCLSNRSGNKTCQSFKCLNCFVYGGFAGPLFLRLSLGFLLHLCSDSLADFECEGCNVRELNMMVIFKERVKDADISEAVGYILKACSGLDSSPHKIHVERVLDAISPKYAPVKPDVGAVEVVDVEVTCASATTSTAQITTETAESTHINVEDRYLVGCLAVVELVESFDQDINSLKNFIRILIDILALRSLLSDNMEQTLKGKWEDEKYTDIINKCMALDTLTIYTHLFSSLVTLLDTVGNISLDKTLFDEITFNMNSFDDDVLWAQHCYLSHRLCPNSNVSNDANVAARLVDLLRKLCDKKEMLTSGKVSAAALSFSKLCSVMPQNSMAEHAPNLVKKVLHCIVLPLSCETCQDVLMCEYGVTKYLLDIAACLVTSFHSPDLAVEILQSQIVIDLTRELCAMNSKKYFVGDSIESNLFLSHVTLLRSLVNHIAMASSTTVGLKFGYLYRLIETISTCYRCSYSACDIAVKDVIMGIVKIASGMIMDPKSAILRLPQFKDFACISKVLDGRDNADSGCTCTGECHHGVQSHGKLRGWVTMVSGVPMVAEESNWLCLNSKRVSMTLVCFPANGYGGDYISLRDTFRNLSILYPPHVNRAPKKSDEIFGCVIRLNKILNSHNKYLQQSVVGHPYPYDVDYLIPFFTGRLCMMLYHQLSIYKRDFEGILQAFGFDRTDKVEEDRQTQLTKMFSLSEAREAARRLHNQISEIQFDQDIGDAFSVPFVEQVIRNGVFEICSLGLLSKSMRKYSMKALGIIMKILQNMLDAAMVRSITPGSHGPFKLRRVGLFGIYQIHSVCCWLQRCQLYAAESDASLHILFASMIVRRVTNPDDPLYKLGNKYLLTRFEPRFQEIPLFFDCFSVQESSERDSFLSFIFQFLLSSAHLSQDHSVFFERRIFQQLMSFALLETTSCEHKIQICDFVQRCASVGSDTADELISLGTLTWISTMSSLIRSAVFNDAKGVVLSTLLVSTLTRLLRDLGAFVCRSLSSVAVVDDVPTPGSPSNVSNDPSMAADDDDTDKVPTKAEVQGDIRSTIKDAISSLEASQNLADAWYHLLRHIPQGMLTTVRLEGYRMYLLTIEKVLSDFREVFEKKPGYEDDTVSKLFSTALHMTASAVVRASALLSKEKIK